LTVAKFYKFKQLRIVSEGDVLVKDEEMLDELKKIRALLEKPPAPAPPKGLWNEFKDFIGKYKVFGLAVAFILGLYLGGLVQALVSDLLLPVIGLAIPGMTNLATYNAGAFTIGHFLVALITFVIVAFVVFLAVKVAKRWGID
jgi:large conductance mechanosensitive channel